MQKTGLKAKTPSLKDNSEQISRIIAEGMQEKKALNIVILDLRSIKSTIADFFVLCTGNSDTHVDAISDSIEEMMFKRLKIDPWHVEGKKNKEWILLDYVDVVAHVFKKDSRKFYSIEQLWGDAGMTWLDDDQQHIEQ